MHELAARIGWQAPLPGGLAAVLHDSGVLPGRGLDSLPKIGLDFIFALPPYSAPV